MEVLSLTIFASVVLGLGAVLFFAWNVRQGSHDHAEHLALLPLADDEMGSNPSATSKEKDETCN